MIVAVLVLIVLAILFPGLLRFALLLAFLGFVYVVGHAMNDTPPRAPTAIERTSK